MTPQPHAGEGNEWIFSLHLNPLAPVPWGTKTVAEGEKLASVKTLLGFRTMIMQLKNCLAFQSTSVVYKFCKQFWKRLGLTETFQHVTC